MNPCFKSSKLPGSHPSRGFLRVIDILQVEEEEEEEEAAVECGCEEDSGMDCVGDRLQDGSSFNQCLSPRRIVARCVAAFRRRRPKERREAKEIKRAKEIGESVCTRCSTYGLDGGTSSSSSLESVGSGRSRKDVSFNLGVGCSLLYLVLASKNELSKMLDLRKQMEIILQDVREELRRKQDLSEPFKSNADVSCSSTYVQEGQCLSYQQDFSYQTPSDSQSTVTKHSGKSLLPEVEKREEGIDELEAEFEAELERLQFHLEVESSSKRIEQLRIKAAKNTNYTGRCCMSSGEVIDPQEEEVHEWRQHGVSPLELERRLHELLESRQIQRIEELECALECATQKIIEKECEISWWKETSKLISQHVPAHFQLRVASQHHGP